jgi:hypothetical protein
LAASVDMATIISAARRRRDQRSFLLQRAQPAMVGLIDGSLSTLAPIFAVAFATHQPRYAFLAGLATAIGAGVSMAFSEGLSDTGDLTGRGRSYLRGAITGAGTFLGGILHTLPFLIPDYRSAVLLALAVIAFELLALAWIRRRFFGTGFLSSLLSVTPAGPSSPRSAPRWAQSADRRRRFSPNPQGGSFTWLRLVLAGQADASGRKSSLARGADPASWTQAIAVIVPGGWAKRWSRAEPFDPLAGRMSAGK